MLARKALVIGFLRAGLLFRECGPRLFDQGEAQLGSDRDSLFRLEQFGNVPMDFKQKTIDDLIESEHLMLSNAPKRYGAYYTIALDSSVFLSSAIKAIGRYHETFVRFNSQVAKHHLLAVFSTVRLHHIQATMNFRQVLENGACAAFAIANPDPTHFANITPEGLLDPSQKLTVKRNDWLNKQFPKGSSQIKAMKDMINELTAHANIAYTNLNFSLADSGDEDRLHHFSTSRTSFS